MMITERNRVYGKTKVYSIDKLKSIFSSKSFEFVKIIVLFGSRARGNNTVRSDYDFAMLFDKSFDDGWGIKSKAYVKIQEEFCFGDGDFDIVDIDSADEVIRNSILEKFVVLKGSEDEFRRILAKK